MKNEFSNLFKSIGIMGVLLILVILFLSAISYFTGAGTEAFHLSLIFVFGQSIVQICTYILWYRKVNHLAADMYNSAEKRKMAFHYKNQYILISVTMTGAIAGAGVIAMFINIIFVGINPTYCYSSIMVMFLIGNGTIFLTMRFWGLPNRVTNSY